MKKNMTTDDFLAWSVAQESGRYELIAGEVVATAPERVRHIETKLATAIGLQNAIKRAGLPCFTLTDGASVKIGANTVVEPDALVYCGARLDGDAILVPDPVIVVEVLSPSTAYNDTGYKLAAYFRIPSVEHYLIIDADRRVVVHHARGAGDVIATRILGEGELTLEPPGIELAVSDLLPPL